MITETTECVRTICVVCVHTTYSQTPRWTLALVTSCTRRSSGTSMRRGRISYCMNRGKQGTGGGGLRDNNKSLTFCVCILLVLRLERELLNYVSEADRKIRRARERLEEDRPELTGMDTVQSNPDVFRLGNCLSCHVYQLAADSTTPMITRRLLCMYVCVQVTTSTESSWRWRRPGRRATSTWPRSSSPRSRRGSGSGTSS